MMLIGVIKDKYSAIQYEIVMHICHFIAHLPLMLFKFHKFHDRLIK